MKIKIKNIIPRIWFAHALVIVGSLILAQTDVEDDTLLYVSLGFAALYVLSLARELIQAAKPSKSVGKKKQIVSYVSTIIWWPFLIIWLLVVTEQMIDTDFWESFRYIHVTVPVIGTIADVVEFLAMNVIGIESRTQEEYVRRDGN